MIRRKVVHIDDSKCDGCGECVPSCEEGAIQIVDGKARLVSDVYCDGLGACLGHCPQGAITIIEREAAPFDEEAVKRHLADRGSPLPTVQATGGCPGASVMQIRLEAAARERAQNESEAAGEAPAQSGLVNWPIQLHLVPVHAPFLRNADVVLAADCVPFALPDFHRQFLNGRPLLIGCPKLDDGESYVHKLAEIIRLAPLRRISVLHMEVPCCTGLLRIAQTAAAVSGTDIPVGNVVISIEGRVLSPAAAR